MSFFYKNKVHLWDGDPRVEDGLLSLKGLEKVTGGWWMEVHNGSVQFQLNAVEFYELWCWAISKFQS